MHACRNYFDWHPVMGGIAALAATAFFLTGLLPLFAAIIPKVRGWPIYSPMNGVVLAVLLMSRRKLWPFLLLGYMLALSAVSALSGSTQRPGILAIFGGVVELLLAAFTLPPFRGLRQWIQEPRLLRAFAGYALILGPAIMALSLAQVSPRGNGAAIGLRASFWEQMWTAGYSEAIGVALGTAVVLVLCNQETYRLFRWRALPGTLGILAFQGLATWFACRPAGYPLVFLPYAILVVITYLLDLRGAVLAIGVTCTVISVVFAQGVFSSVQASAIQSYLAIVCLTTFPLGVAVFKSVRLDQRIKEQQAELDKLKSIDWLTGVSNRKRFDLVLAREWQRATRDPKPIALLIIDTDFFEPYYELYGVEAGDRCLRLIASKLADQPRRAYDLVARLQAGRFSILLPGASVDAVKRIAEEFRAEIIAQDWPHKLSPFGRVTVTIGWAAETPENGLNPDVLISAAEHALSVARKNGKNRVEGYTSTTS